MRRWIGEMREGFRVLASRRFWRAFAHYWSGPEISRRLDNWNHDVRKATGQKPDEKLEQRRQERGDT